jgi:hypothetical protein
VANAIETLITALYVKIDDEQGRAALADRLALSRPV